jgi:hypothetical protein
VAAVKADASGTVWVTANIFSKQKLTQQYFTIENGKQVVRQQEVEQTVSSHINKQLGDFGGKFVAADGSSLSTEEATRRVKNGATLLITADGKPVDAGWLKAVAGDTVVMVAEGFGQAHFVHGYNPYPTTAAPRLAMLGTDAKGEVRLPVNPSASTGGAAAYGRSGRVIVQGNDAIWIDGSAPAQAGAAPGADGKKALADLQFDAYDVTGKLIHRADALKRLKAGGLVLIAGDGRFPDANYLKAFEKDLLVLASQELVFPPGVPNPYDVREAKADTAVRPNKAPVVPAAQPLPAVQLKAAAAVKIQGAGGK